MHSISIVYADWQHLSDAALSITHSEPWFTTYLGAVLSPPFLRFSNLFAVDCPFLNEIQIEQLLILKPFLPLSKLTVLIPPSFESFFGLESGLPKTTKDVGHKVRVELFDKLNWFQFNYKNRLKVLIAYNRGTFVP